MIAPGKRANVLQVFEDVPLDFDAWDIDRYYQDKAEEVDDLVSATVEEAGPVRGVLRLEWHYRHSTVVQRMVVYCQMPRIDFETSVDWREQQALLKAAFPVDVRATQATYDIQFGNMERPTHWNTNQDQAQFEVPGQKWVDLSQEDSGASLLNDCKYGYDVKGQTLRLTLIKSAVEPDPQADQGIHCFTYSLLPHSGDWREGKTHRQAHQLNFELNAELVAAQPNGKLPAETQFAALNVDHVMVETVKQSESGESWVIRVYEYHNRQNDTVDLTFPFPIADASECDLMEESIRPTRFEGRRLTFGIRPYEIKTFSVTFK
jgi:alpha-mannosidase